MDQLEMTPRPRKGSSELAGMRTFTLFWSGACVLLIVMALRDASRPALIAAGVGAVSLALMLGIVIRLLWTDRQDKRRYPGRLQAYLDSPLSPGDYEKLDRIARLYPDVQPWIRDTMRDGEIRYRDAELLQQRINIYLAALPRKQLQDRLDHS